MKNNFMTCASLHHWFFGKLFRFYRLHHANQGAPCGFRKTVSKNAVFGTTPHHAARHTTHHPLSCCYSISPGLLHIKFIEKNIYVYMLLNAYIGLYVKENPWATPGSPGRNANFFPEF